MSKFKIYLTGNIFDLETVLYFKSELLRLGGDIISITEKSEEANMEVDISTIDATANITEEALEVISTANNLMQYEKKRRKIIRKVKQKVLVASSNEKKALYRKYIN